MNFDSLLRERGKNVVYLLRVAGKMRKSLAAVMIVVLVALPFYFFPQPRAISNSTPFTPHEVRVLVVSPANLYLKGGHYLISDLARYGFNVTQHTSDNATAVDYLSDQTTSNLDQYDVVILHGGYFRFPPTTVSLEEVNHFTNYGGILIVIGNALFGNESTRLFWDEEDKVFVSEPIQKLEQRLGVDFTGYLGGGGAWHNNGTLSLTDDSIKGLPSSLSYVTNYPISINYQVVLTAIEGGSEIYDFTVLGGPFNGKKTSGVTYYKNPATGAVGIYIQGSFIYATEEPADSLQIRYFGLTDISKRSSLLASLIAHAFGADINTIIKPQPLASIRLDYLGGRGFDESYLNVSLLNFHSTIGEYGIIPTIAFTDAPHFDPNYWQESVPNILSQLKGKYKDWEYSSSLRNKNSSSMMQSEIEVLLRNIKGNFAALGIDQFNAIATFAGYWNQTTLDAMASENLHLLDMSGHPEISGLGKYYPDWWNLRVVDALTSNVVVHSAAIMGWWGAAEYFTQIDSNPDVAKNILHFEYSKDRDKWALAVVNGFPAFTYGVWHFRRNEVGTYSLQTVYANLTSEVPDIQFVPLVEAGLYFGNKWVNILNPIRNGATIEFDVDSSAVPDVVSIGKGMLWLRVGTNETIREVSIDGEPWFYFDDHTIRLPADSVHVKVTLGERVDPTVVRTVYKVTETSWDGERFTVSVSTTPGLNVSIRLQIPFWNAFCNETQWDYKFDASAQILEFWAISDGSIALEVGADVTSPVLGEVDRSPTWYNTSVTVAVSFSDLETGVRTAILSYSSDSDWINVTMVREDGLYVGIIPAFRYGTEVKYKLYASDNAENWKTSGIFSYNVTDETPPEIGVPEWSPMNPSAGQPVHVQVSVVEPENASGLDSVEAVFFFERDYSTADSVQMKYDDGLWSAEIPGQSGGKLVSFFIRAKDKAGNFGISEDYSYRVGGAGLPWYMLIFGLVLITIGIGAGLYFTKFRKVKRQG